MWMLKDASGGFKYLKPNKTIKVGRKDADIILENDTSVSRTHASITVTLKEEVQTSEESSICMVKDSNSKYGSFIVRNGSQIKVSKDGDELHHGDTLTFGLQNYTYSVQYIHLVTVVSRLNANHKKQLKTIMDDIGGLIIDFYNIHCTHLTASTAVTTSKILFALISGIPIIGIDYWIEVKKCIDENKVFPDPNQFTLSMQDTGINIQKVSLKPNPSRKTLFCKKTFIFFTEKSYKEYREMIQQAGGVIKLYPISSTLPDDIYLDNCIIIKVTTNDSSTEDLTTFDTLLQNCVKERNLRTINETEIPLAIMYANLNQYCNPKYDFAKLLRRKSHVEDTSEVLAVDTQDIGCIPVNKNTKSKVSNPVIVSETNDIQDNSSQSPKAVLNEDSGITDISEQVRHRKTPNKASVKNIDDFKERPVKIEEAFEKKSNEKVKTPDRALLRPINRNKSKEGKEASPSSPSNTEDDNLHEKKRGKSNKRQRKTSDIDEINENIQKFFPNKKRGSIEIPKVNTEVGDVENFDFIKKEPESQLTETDYNRKCKADKWGFRKSNKRAIDFDLDDMDVGKFKNVAGKSKNDVSDSSTRESPKDFDLDDMDASEFENVAKKSKSDMSDSSTKEFPKDFDLDDMDENESKKISKKSKFDVSDSSTKKFPKDFDLDDMDENESNNISKKSKFDVSDRSDGGFPKAELLIRNKKTETIVEPEKDVEIKKNIQLKIKPIDIQSKKNYIKSTIDDTDEDEIDEGKNILIKSDLVRSFKSEVDADNPRCVKKFKKLHNQVPVTRVPLADMTIWKVNDEI